MPRRSGHNGRTDANQTEYVKKLRACGVSVTILSGVGDGCPDIMAGAFNRHLGFVETIPVEIKTPGHEDDLTPDEVEWWHSWKGSGLAGSSNPDDVLQYFGVI